MYKRAYPPRNTPLPENYSGVAWMTEEPTVEEPPREETDEVTTEPAATIQAHTYAPESAKRAEEENAPLPPGIATADMLLLAVAALISQNGSEDGELLMLLLLLLLGE